MSPEVLEPDALLGPAPARASDILIGYARISTRGQHIEPQLDQLNAVGCRRVRRHQDREDRGGRN